MTTSTSTPSSSPVSETPATGSSAPAADVDGAASDAGGLSRFERVRPYLVPAGLALLVGTMAALMLASHRPGHWWGDDWALYVRQARSLIDGNPGAITADNHFTVDSSLGAPFSPPLYPWGFPIIMAPFIAVVGTDVDALTIVPVLSACVFACSWFVLARRRLGTLVAFVSTPAITLTPLLLSWTELIQSEWPFLAVTFGMLAAVDRAIDSRVLTDTAARVWPLVLLGVGAAAAFSVRREGLAIVAAIAAAQLGLLTTDSPSFRRLFSDRSLAARLIVPHLSALATVLALQWLLPSTLVPQYSGTSLRNTYQFWERHVRHLADVVGLKNPWDSDPTILGSAFIYHAVVVLFFVAAVAGIMLAVTLYRRRDLHLAVYAVIAFLIGGSFRSAVNRYVATVGPALLLLCLIALVALPGRRHRRWGVALATFAVALLLVSNLVNANRRLDAAADYADRGAVEWGAQHPDAVEMFDIVITNSELDDIVAGPKARALTLLTDRRAIQVDAWRPLPSEWSPTLVVTERGSAIETQLVNDEQHRYTQIWANPRFAVYRSID